jgi:DNA invertase Pin-like site-specific DNA recombinase
VATIGYARVSSLDQDFDSQVERLAAAGCSKVYSEKASGKSTNGRHALDKAIRSPHGELILTVMGGMAEFERKLIRTRCDEGIKRAKARGTVFGRKSVLDAGQRRKIAERYAAGETMAALAGEYKVGEATVWRALRAG